MAREIGRLKAVTVAKAKTPGMLADGAGLYLRVGPIGTKSWVFRYRHDGKLHDMGLGPVHTLTLAEAREKAQACRKLRLDGIDPIQSRRANRAEATFAAAASMTFRECAERYVAAHKAGWRNEKHAAQWPSTLEAYVYPVLGNLAVQAIDTGLVTRAIEPIWTEKPETASRVRGRIEAVLDWATARGFRAGENPARWRGHLKNLLPARNRVQRVHHHAALPYAEISGFLLHLRQQDGIPARALEFLILTAARAGEVIGARWEEINLGERLWTIPAERMKGGREHRVPLSDAALAIVDAMADIRQSEFVFPGAKAGRSLSNMAMLMLMRRMGRGNLTIHGFRSSFRDWAAERTSYPAEVAEMALAHAVGAAVGAATYSRSAVS
jgi:integrase